MAQSIPLDLPRAERLRRLRDAASDLRLQRSLPWLSFAAVAGLAFGLSAWHLSVAGYGNTYYAAAVRSMSMSWKNFFFGSFDPGAFITVDKPPVFLWVDALSVRVFGYSSWALLLPSAFAGAATVALAWLILRKYFGAFAATLGALVLVFTPISVAVDRLNLPEPFYILALVAAAWAALRSLESRRWWAWTILAGALVGVAFNAKMLAAWIPGPAFALALVVGDSSSWRLNLKRILGRLALLAAATFIVSASWMLVVDAWPASSRPYIGGSTNNTVSDLVLGYNGFGRVDGAERGPGGGPPPAGVNRAAAPGGQAPFFNRGQQPRAGSGNNTPANRTGPGGANGPGGIIAGSPGPFRMLDSANGGQIAWFIPFGLLGSLLALWNWRKDRVRRAVVILAAGWVLLFAGVFSEAQGIYHSYYTSALAPGIALLVGATVAASVSLLRRDWRWILPIAGIVGATAWVQLSMAGRFPDFQAQYRPIAVLVVVGGGLFALQTVIQKRIGPSAAMAVVIGGLLVLPASWALPEVTNPSLNATLPQAGPRQGAAGRSFGSAAFDNGTASLASWLEANRAPGGRWDLVVSSAQSASTLVAEHSLSVMALGGFLGSDPTISVSQFASYVAQGNVRYVEVSGGPGGFGGRGFGGFAPPIGLFGGQSPFQAPNNQFQAPSRSPIPNRRSQAPNGQFQLPFSGNQAQGGPGSTFQAPPVQGAASTADLGSSAVLRAVSQVCTPVNSPTLPAQYQGSIYDCSGKADALRAAGPSGAATP